MNDAKPLEEITKIELAEWFNEKHGCTLHEQTLKMQEEAGEVSEAVLGFTGDLLFKDPTTSDDVGNELADLLATAYYISALAGIDDIEDRARWRLEANLNRASRNGAKEEP